MRRADLAIASTASSPNVEAIKLLRLLLGRLILSFRIIDMTRSPAKLAKL